MNIALNIDVLDEGTLLPPLRRGTRLIFSPVGAYNVTQWMHFIEYRPAVVLVGEDGRPLTVAAPLPADLERVLEGLRA